MIRPTECELQELYLWHVNLFSSIYVCILSFFICTRFGLGLGVFDPQQIVCYVWLDSYNDSRYVVHLFV